MKNKVDTETQNTPKKNWDWLFDVPKISWIILYFSSLFVSVIFASIIHVYYPKEWMITGEMMEGNFVFTWIWGILQIAFVWFFIVQQVRYKYRYSPHQYLLLSYIWFTYLLLWNSVFPTDGLVIDRIASSGWLSCVGYFDLVFLLIAFSVVFSIFRDVRLAKRGVEQNIFLEDNPLHKVEELSQFSNLLTRIEPALFKDKYESAFSIGVIGPWGAGKSSFIRALEKKVKNHPSFNSNTIYISFSPFLNHNEDKVIHEFFVQLSDELKKRSGRLSKLLLNYSVKLSNAVSNGDFLSFFKPSGLTSEDKSVAELYKKIEGVIRSLDLKIIISIDDLDRLNAKEILEVLKLVRNTSNFPNLVFIVALDKEYVLERLSGELNHKKGYLDKFFQLEVHVFDNSFDKLNAYYSARITTQIDLVGVPEHCVPINLAPKYHFWVKNYRDVNRIINQFLLDYQLINDDLNYPEIDSTDLLNLTILKVKYPKLFDELRNNRIKSLSVHELAGILAFDVISGSKVSEKDMVDKGEVEDFREVDFDNDAIEERYGIMLLLQLFGFKPEINDALNISIQTKQNSIRLSGKIRYYFERTVAADTMTIAEFESILQLDNDVLKPKLEELSVSGNKLDNFRTKLKEKVSENEQTFTRRIISQSFLCQISSNESTPFWELNTFFKDFRNWNEKEFKVFSKDFVSSGVFDLHNKAKFILLADSIIRYIEIEQEQVDDAIWRVYKYRKADSLTDRISMYKEAFWKFDENIEIQKLLREDFSIELDHKDSAELIENLIEEDGGNYFLSPGINDLFENVEGFSYVLRSLSHEDSANPIIESAIEFLDLEGILRKEQVDFSFQLEKEKVDYNKFIENDGVVQVLLYLSFELADLMVASLKKHLSEKSIDNKWVKSGKTGNWSLFIPRLKQEQLEHFVALEKLCLDIFDDNRRGTIIRFLGDFEVGSTTVVNNAQILKILSIQKAKMESVKLKSD